VFILLGLVVFTGCEAGGDATVTTVPATEWTGPPPKAPVLFPVRENDKWGYIDTTGTVVVGFQYDDARDFSDGMAAVKVGSTWGYIDESGAMIIAPQFFDGLAFSNDRAGAYSPSRDIGYIDKSGQVVIPDSPDWLAGGQFSEGLAGVELKEGYGFIDTSGRLVLRFAQATSLGDFREGLAVVRIGHECGYVDRTGKFVIQPQFGYATEFSNGVAMVQYGYGRAALIDKTGRVQRRLAEYNQAGPVSEGRIAVYQGELLDDASSWGYIDASGTRVIPPQFHFAWEFEGGLARVEEKNGKLAYIDLLGNYVWQEK
jgi:hypothetical protein